LLNSLSGNRPSDLLAVDIKHRAGALSLHVSFALTQPWTVLFGPSGSGKTTVLRAISGFLQPSAGSIVRGEYVLVDVATKRFVPAHERPVRSAGQTPKLFPHMTVRSNLLFGCGSSSKPDSASTLADQALELFRLAGFGERMPEELSGGERQRVSVARAVISATTFSQSGPALLLLDEPFTGLDVRLRDELLADLKPWLGDRGVPVLSVTHDIGEAFQLGAEVVKLSNGTVVHQGPAAEVLAEERGRLLAQLQGIPRVSGA
jgi:molybdate transport system ATP-binding protein